jgi:tRNA(Ile)-lysidine synthase
MPAPSVKRFFQAGDRVAVAVSGGADSVALLALLMEARDELGIVVAIAHYNHRLRGEASDDDARFVEQLARARNVEYFTATSTTLHDRNIEALARRDRYAFFSQLVGSVKGDGRVKKIATAHTADDQAETVLTRLLRGAGPAGMSGILPSLDGGAIVRPLLDTRRADLRAWATDRALTWREDASNLDDRFLRNRIRHQLLPLLEREYNPAIVDVLGRAAEVARADEAEWQSQTEELAARLLSQEDGPERVWKLPLPDFVKLSEGQQRRLLRAAMMRAKGDLRRIDFRHVEQIRLLALKQGAGGRLELPGIKVEVHGNWVKIRV